MDKKTASATQSLIFSEAHRIANGNGKSHFSSEEYDQAISNVLEVTDEKTEIDLLRELAKTKLNQPGQTRGRKKDDEPAQPAKPKRKYEKQSTREAQRNGVEIKDPAIDDDPKIAEKPSYGLTEVIDRKTFLDGYRSWADKYDVIPLDAVFPHFLGIGENTPDSARNRLRKEGYEFQRTSLGNWYVSKRPSKRTIEMVLSELNQAIAKGLPASAGVLLAEWMQMNIEIAKKNENGKK